MLRSKWLGATLTLGLSALLVGGSLAGGDKDKKGDGKDGKEPEIKLSKVGQTIREVHAAYEMAHVAKEKNLPEGLVAAAKILGTAGRVKGEVHKDSKVGKALDFDEQKEAMMLLADAEKMAKGTDCEAAIKTLIAEAKKDIGGVKRGGIYGPRTYASFFRGDGIDRLDRYHVTARGGEYLCITLNGWGYPGLDLDLELWEGGSLLRSERSVGPNSHISFPVPYGGARTYTIHVINYTSGIICDRYTLSHN